MPVYLVAAYLVLWALPLLLLYSIWARQRQVERQLANLAAQIDQVRSNPD